MLDGNKALKIIAGLGNPGRKYSETRHNAGWMALDELARRRGPGAEEARCGGLVLRCGRLWLFKPLGFMNLSGPPVARILRESGADLEQLLVVVDDLDLPLGAIRLRPGGSSGGHRGIESLIDTLGTEAFARLRLGIGPCPPQDESRDFVLSPFAADEWETVDSMIERAAEAALCWAQEGIAPAMNRHNRRSEGQ
jgi:PTH1 family peptidyl-tRNA hydrolase